MKDNQAFQKAYAMLDSAQKLAVDTVEGPVLVIAGPGTGKTHILTLRIANILKETQANATNILVLTFTESAARTVRQRLAALIGEETARDVFISTFHGFANHVLEEYADFFPAWAGKRQAGNIESTLLWREVLETEELVHLRTPKSPFFYLRDLARLRDDLARERERQDAPRLALREAPGAEVEESVGVEAARRRAVGAPDVVVVDLELRLGVDARRVGEEEVPVRLVGVGEGPGRADDDLPVERAARRPREDPLVALLAPSVGPRVVDERVVVDLLSPPREEEAVERGAGPVAVEADCQLVAGDPRPDRQDP